MFDKYSIDAVCVLVKYDVGEAAVGWNFQKSTFIKEVLVRELLAGILKKKEIVLVMFEKVKNRETYYEETYFPYL